MICHFLVFLLADNAKLFYTLSAYKLISKSFSYKIFILRIMNLICMQWYYHINKYG